MSLVSHDSIWTQNHGVVHKTYYGEDKEKNIEKKRPEEEDRTLTYVEKETNIVSEVGEKENNTFLNINGCVFIKEDESNHNEESKKNPILKKTNYVTTDIKSCKGEKKNNNIVQEKDCVSVINEKECKVNKIRANNDLNKKISTKCNENLCTNKKTNNDQLKSANEKKNRNSDGNANENTNRYYKNIHRQKDIKICASNALKSTFKNIKSKWSWNSGVLISLMVLNVAGRSYADDTDSFSAGLTSRMIASILGYPSTCTLNHEVRPCSLTISCWLRGGRRLRGCGGWLFSCCGPSESNADTLSNDIPSSEWKYKPSPPKLRQVPQRNVMPNNVFRRRVDDDVTQLDCGLPSSRILQKRIIGGREARFAEFPWQAHIRISEFQCGGVLVSRRYVATAAHCVSRAHTRDIAVWLGAIDTSATHHPARKLGVIQKILHPLFQFRMTQPDRYDIALLKLSRPITYMSNILPICLPDYDMELRGRSGVIAGWGKTDASSGHTGTNLLRSATVPILSKEQCITWHESKQISVEIHSEMICAGHSDGHQDACLGDSGGPLIVLDNGRYYLVGITSAGFGCGVDHQPGIYHNVKLTANWIRSVIAPPVNYNDNYLK